MISMKETVPLRSHMQASRLRIGNTVIQPCGMHVA